MNILAKISGYDALAARVKELEASAALAAGNQEHVNALESALATAAEENKALADQNAQFVTAIKKAGEDLAAERAAHEATKKSVEVVASQKAAATLGASGSVMIEVKAGAQNDSTMTRAEFTKLSPAAQSKFVLNGGKITN